MKQLDISIVTYNSSKWIDNFFTSLANQEFPSTSINLYITDNDSTDETFETLQKKNYNLIKSFYLLTYLEKKTLALDMDIITTLNIPPVSLYWLQTSIWNLNPTLS